MSNVVCLHKFKVDKILRNSHEIVGKLRGKWIVEYITNGHEFNVNYGDQMERDFIEVELICLGYNNKEVEMIFDKVGM